MSARVKVKEVKVTLGSKDAELSDMFSQMLGTGTVNIHIAYPRYTAMWNTVNQLIKLFDVLAMSPLMESFPTERLELVTFCRVSREQVAEVFSINLTDEYGWDISTVEPALCKKFSDVYLAMKRSNLVNKFIVMCDRLVEYKSHFADLNKLSYQFINNMSGVEWAPLPFTQMNLKHVMSLDIGDGAKMFIMTVLSRAFTLSHSLYVELQAPDIDVDQFVDFIMVNIERVQKHPDLARCGDAFKKIKESVRMLRERFNGYYRDFIDTQDSSIIMQHFILDVSKTGTASAKVTGQFRTIISFYKKVAAQKGDADPRMKSLFERLSASFKHTDADTLNLVKADAAECDSAPIAAAPPVAIPSQK